MKLARVTAVFLHLTTRWSGCGNPRRSAWSVGADASRRANGAHGLRPRVARRYAPANTRLERTPAPASQLASASAAQPRAPFGGHGTGGVGRLRWQREGLRRARMTVCLRDNRLSANQ